MIDARSALAAARRLGVWWVTALLAGLGVVVIASGQLRAGGYLLAAGCAAGGMLRAIRPLGHAGGLAVRRRSVDVVLWLGLAGLVALAFTLVRL
ncbi:MAG: DUF3017 domain-containing protein [Candidatus Phosphoribacter baldrii]|jgi:hypothetical protein|nr:DUF3017 domain-containing protein [Candidatus Phosphoribacter baldrii]MBK6441875.1 DUF3017 domain-containing protein [Candidatus Phosphoribacter baldrii]MBK6954611.1 DUF3017 domain-containing protein [Candidatus Phosphoribacter baldrii]